MAARGAEQGGSEFVKHVLILSIGPIQSFIAAARRCRDLWFGSWLLSELSKAAALGVAQAPGCGVGALVFPHAADLAVLAPGSGMSVANKIVARVPDPDEAGRGAVEALRARLRTLRDQAFEQIVDSLGGGGMFKREVAEAQVEDLFDVAWASAVEEGEDGYATARQAAEQLLAARKATRLWKRVSWGRDVLKSSLDGERESVLDERLYAGSWTEGELRQCYGVGAQERLCGVGLLKRHGTRRVDDHRFISTPHLAAWPLLARLERMARETGDDRVRAAWARYLAELTDAGAELDEVKTAHREHPVTGRYDGQLLFEGRLADRFSHLPLGERAKPVQRAVRALRTFLGRVDLKAPLPYFAVLVADGDHMGRLIERQRTAQDHIRLSRALAGFAEGARAIVENQADHEGELIYAGGDDVLAFVPLHRAVGCARELSRDFAGRLREFRAEGEAPPSLSVGLGISHFMTPMGRALEVARTAEEHAKELRDALAVVVAKRGGAAVAVRGAWGSVDGDLDALTAMHRADRVPDKAAFDLLELERIRRRAPEDARSDLNALVRSETVWILKRKQPKHGSERRIDPNALDHLLAQPEALAQRLLVARLLAQAEDVAGLPLREEEEA